MVWCCSRRAAPICDPLVCLRSANVPIERCTIGSVGVETNRRRKGSTDLSLAPPLFFRSFVRSIDRPLLTRPSLGSRLETTAIGKPSRLIAYCFIWQWRARTGEHESRENGHHEEERERAHGRQVPDRGARGNLPHPPLRCCVAELVRDDDVCDDDELRSRTRSPTDAKPAEYGGGRAAGLVREAKAILFLEIA